MAALLERRRALLEGAFLPAQYELRAYLQSPDNSNYIDLGLAAATDVDYTIRFTVTNYDTAESQLFFGALRNGNKSERFLVKTGISPNTLTGGKTTGYKLLHASPIAGKMYEVDVNGNAVSVNGVSMGTFQVQQNWTSGVNMHLFSVNGWTNTQPLFVRVHYLEIRRAGSVVREMYPCVRRADGTAGMYDTAQGRFYENEGDGEFSAG